MAGVAFTSTQASGVTTTFVTIVDIRWKPLLSADIQLGYFVDEPTFNNGGQPVHTEYFSLDITQIVPTGNIPAQIMAQLLAPGAPLYGGTPVS
jgi:hypothetical protein